MRIRTRTSSRRRTSWVLAVALVGAFAVVPSADGSGLGPGCDPERAAVVHRPSGADPGPGVRPRVPCGTETGRYTGETTIGVTDDGTVWFSAADWEWALVRSSDDGATWERFTVPGPQAFPGCGGGTTALTPRCDDSQRAKNNTVADAFLWVDPDTSALYWSKTYGYALCSSMNYSRDAGTTWRPVTSFACPGGDYEKIAGGPAPAGQPQPVGYPNVLYTCYNGPAPTFVVGPARNCQRSLDGGQTWAYAGSPVPSPLAPGCLHFQEPPAVGPDGTVYQPLGCGALDLQNPAGLVKVAVSRDEATTWSYVNVPTADVGFSGDLIGGVSLAVDEAGAVHVVWTGDDGRAYLASTPDDGATWTGPLAVSAPGVTVANPKPQIAAQAPGHVAIAYYGAPEGAPNGVRHGYLTESFEAGAADPLLYSAQLNRTDDPLYFPTDGGSLPRNDYLGVTIAPDGTPWTALVKLRTAESDAEGFIQSTGFAGRLTWGANGR